MAYRILLHRLPVVAILFTQSNNNEQTCSLHTVVRPVPTGLISFHTVCFSCMDCTCTGQRQHLLANVDVYRIFQVLNLQNLHVVKYGIFIVK